MPAERLRLAEPVADHIVYREPYLSSHSLFELPEDRLIGEAFPGEVSA